MWSISSIWPSIGLLDYCKGILMSLYNMMSTGTSFDSWLTTDTEAERHAASEDVIEDRVKELCNHNADYDHRLFENFSQDVYSATIEQAESIEDYLKSKDFEKLGRLLWCISFESREKSARIQAQNEFDNGDLNG
jgi:hypothetical protein